ncbi:MAG TPA: SirB2 family protein [Gallionella sp.]|nr:SirB2 family protein [Gallionella sp.]
MLALLLYIALGFIALKYGRSRTVRISAWIMAQLVFVYIVLVAISHNPWPFAN